MSWFAIIFSGCGAFCLARGTVFAFFRKWRRESAVWALLAIAYYVAAIFNAFAFGGLR